MPATPSVCAERIRLPRPIFRYLRDIARRDQPRCHWLRLGNNVYAGGLYGPTLPGGWGLRGAADFNRDSHPDYALFAPNTFQTAIWYLSGPTLIAGAYGPSIPSDWELVAVADFNGDSYPDYALYNAGTRQTAIWYLNNNVYVGGGYGPTLPAGWSLVGVADFNRDGHTDYALFNPGAGQTAIWYLSGLTLFGGVYGPSVPYRWQLVALGKCHNPLFGQSQHSRLCADGRQRDDWRIHCTRDSTKEGDSACDWP